MGELNNIGLKTGTDKNSIYHGYLDIYESYLKDWKEKNIALIELGTGGYHYPDRGGEGVRMWYQYFKSGKIVSVDIHPKENIINDRTEFWQGGQTDKHLLKTIIGQNNDAALRVVIDDASHNNKLTIESFQIIFPLLKSGDYYFVEDAQTSYWDDEEYKGNKVPGDIETTMGYFTYLTHQMNWEVLQPEYRNEYADKILFVHFYKELIVIKKK